MSDEPRAASDDDLPEQMRVRREKRERLLADGGEAYPVSVAAHPFPGEIRASYGDLPTDTATGVRVGVAGRVMFVRNTGKLCFATLREGDGTELQAMLSLDRVGAESLEAWKRLVDLGDMVGGRRRGHHEQARRASVLADRWVMAAKALRPLPVAHKPMSEEARVRQRYVDLIMRPQARETVRTRADRRAGAARLVSPARLLEAETPMLQLLHGGAAARPFVTHSNALDSTSICGSRRSCTSSAAWSAASSGSSRSTGTSATRGSTRRILRSSRCSRHTRRTATTTRSATLTRELVQEAAQAGRGIDVVRHHDGSEFDLGGDWEHDHALRLALCRARRRSYGRHAAGDPAAAMPRS